MSSEAAQSAGVKSPTVPRRPRLWLLSAFLGLIIGLIGGFAVANAIDRLVGDKTFCIRSRESAADLGGTEPGEVFWDGESGCRPLDYVICVHAGSRRPVEGRCQP